MDLLILRKTALAQVHRLVRNKNSPWVHDERRRFPMELTHTRGQSTARSNHLVQAMRQHPLLFYFLLAFAFSWAYELLIFGVLHVAFNLFSNVPVILGPTLAAFLMTAVT